MRTQHDGLQELYSYESGIACDPAEDLTRQEFKDTTDVNNILARHGVPVAQPLPYGEVDYDLDLTQAYASLATAREAIGRLPADLLEAVGGIDAAFAAAAAGALRLPTDPPSSPAEGSGSSATVEGAPPASAGA